MKSNSFYEDLLLKQCNNILNLKSSVDLFSKFSQKLRSDFLPPLDRENISDISLSLLKIENSVTKDILENELIYLQLSEFKNILSDLFNKRKTCEERIRRLIILNFKFEKETKDIKLLTFNNLIGDFIKSVNNTYFKNL